MSDVDPTRIELQTNVKRDKDPMIQRMSGIARAGNTPFDVPFISHIHGNLYQGGCSEDELHLQLPHFFKHLISMYPWERYKVERGQLDTELYFKMYDDELMRELLEEDPKRRSAYYGHAGDRPLVEHIGIGRKGFEY